jgi:hypothetical protein
MTINKVNNKNSIFIYENPKRINKIILLLILTIFSGCKKTNLSKSEMTKYLKDESNGFSITKNTDIFPLPSGLTFNGYTNKGIAISGHIPYLSTTVTVP